MIRHIDVWQEDGKVDQYKFTEEALSKLDALEWALQFMRNYEKKNKPK